MIILFPYPLQKMDKETSKVTNVKVAFIRPKYQNLEEWCSDPHNIYIGRRGIVFINKERYPKTDSIWANPFKIGKDGDRIDVLQKYEEYITERLKNEPELLKNFLTLRGKNLGCWCSPESCHGDILCKLLEKWQM